MAVAGVIDASPPTVQGDRRASAIAVAAAHRRVHFLREPRKVRRTGPTDGIERTTCGQCAARDG